MFKPNRFYAWTTGTNPKNAKGPFLTREEAGKASDSGKKSHIMMGKDLQSLSASWDKNDGDKFVKEDSSIPDSKKQSQLVQFLNQGLQSSGWKLKVSGVVYNWLKGKYVLRVEIDYKNPDSFSWALGEIGNGGTSYRDSGNDPVSKSAAKSLIKSVQNIQENKQMATLGRSRKSINEGVYHDNSTSESDIVICMDKEGHKFYFKGLNASGNYFWTANKEHARSFDSPESAHTAVKQIKAHDPAIYKMGLIGKSHGEKPYPIQVEDFHDLEEAIDDPIDNEMDEDWSADEYNRQKMIDAPKGRQHNPVSAPGHKDFVPTMDEEDDVGQDNGQDEVIQDLSHMFGESLEEGIGAKVKDYFTTPKKPKVSDPGLSWKETLGIPRTDPNPDDYEGPWERREKEKGELARYNKRKANPNLADKIKSKFTKSESVEGDVGNNIACGAMEADPDSVITEKSAPGQEAWIKANKSNFIREYGKKKGLEVLYATAWKRSKKNESVNESDNWWDGLGDHEEEPNHPSDKDRFEKEPDSSKYSKSPKKKKEKPVTEGNAPPFNWKVWNQGQDDYEQNGGNMENPYEGTQWAMEWKQGYDAAAQESSVKQTTGRKIAKKMFGRDAVAATSPGTPIKGNRDMKYESVNEDSEVSYLNWKSAKVGGEPCRYIDCDGHRLTIVWQEGPGKGYYIGSMDGKKKFKVEATVPNQANLAKELQKLCLNKTVDEAEFDDETSEPSESPINGDPQAQAVFGRNKEALDAYKEKGQLDDGLMNDMMEFFQSKGCIPEEVSEGDADPFKWVASQLDKILGTDDDWHAAQDVGGTPEDELDTEDEQIQHFESMFNEAMEPKMKKKTKKVNESFEFVNGDSKAVVDALGTMLKNSGVKSQYANFTPVTTETLNPEAVVKESVNANDAMKALLDKMNVSVYDTNKTVHVKNMNEDLSATLVMTKSEPGCTTSLTLSDPMGDELDKLLALSGMGASMTPVTAIVATDVGSSAGSLDAYSDGHEGEDEMGAENAEGHEEVVDEDDERMYDNSPHEDEFSLDSQLNKGSDLHRPKGQYAKEYPGDNRMDTADRNPMESVEDIEEDEDAEDLEEGWMDKFKKVMGKSEKPNLDQATANLDRARNEKKKSNYSMPSSDHVSVAAGNEPSEHNAIHDLIDRGSRRLDPKNIHAGKAQQLQDLIDHWKMVDSEDAQEKIDELEARLHKVQSKMQQESVEEVDEGWMDKFKKVANNVGKFDTPKADKAIASIAGSFDDDERDQKFRDEMFNKIRSHDSLKKESTEEVDEASALGQKVFKKVWGEHPKDIIRTQKSHDDNTVKNLYDPEDKASSKTPRGVQMHSLKKEMEKRGLKKENALESKLWADYKGIK